MTRVSIVLPTYNGAKWIKRSIQSVQTQSFTDWELLVVSDGSYDETEEIVLSLCKEDSRILFIKNEDNLGIQKTLNRGIEKSQGQYIARIDDDDIWSDNRKLEKQVNFLDSNPEGILVGTGTIVVDETHVEMFRYLNPETDQDVRDSILRRNPFTHSSVLFRKKYKGVTFLYSESPQYKNIEDYELWLRMGAVGKFYNIPDHCVSFMSRAGSITQKNRYSQFLRSIALIRQYKKRYPKYWSSLLFAYMRIFLLKIFKCLPKKIQIFIFNFYKNS